MAPSSASEETSSVSGAPLPNALRGCFRAKGDGFAYQMNGLTSPRQCGWISQLTRSPLRTARQGRLEGSKEDQILARRDAMSHLLRTPAGSGQ